VGVRWYELRSLSTVPTVYQQGTYAPDSGYRWMGSIAMDKAGNIALGYSVSSGSMHPAIRYTGRGPTDPLGTMGSETSIIEGGGSQLRGLSRWGDYSSMSIDPVDDCTFWYTSEYLKFNGSFNWSSRIASFEFPSCSSTPTPPPAPVNLTATAGNAQVTLTWSASSGATSYNVLRSTASGGPYSQVATGVTTTTSTDTGLTNGQTYYYVVQAVNSAGPSANSNEASATPTCALPAAPAGLSATPGDSQVSLSWTVVSGATGYNVKRSTNGSSYVTIAYGWPTTSYTDPGLTNGTTYYYVVSAVSSCGEGANSTQVSATPSAVTVPAAPTGLTATAGPGAKKITLSWTGSSGATSYNVKRGTTSGGPYTTIATTTATGFTNIGLTSGKTYFYVVSAVNSAGTSPNSSQAFAIAK
jgi:fibronectin type 3 domain-containing protein